MSYIACTVASGTAYVADTDELAELEWVALAGIPEFVPYGLFKPVQAHLDSVLS